MPIDPALGRQDYCYITTSGRITGRPHRIEIWFALHGDTIYMLAGGGLRSDWVRNLQNAPAAPVAIGGRAFDGQARIVSDAEEDALARRLLLEKYAPTNDDLDEWGRIALPVAIELAER